MSDGIGLAEAMLGLDGIRMLEVSESRDELVVRSKRLLMLSAARALGCGRRAAGSDTDRNPRSCMLRSAGAVGVG
jgi:hypothetical protein